MKLFTNSNFILIDFFYLVPWKFPTSSPEGPGLKIRILGPPYPIACRIDPWTVVHWIWPAFSVQTYDPSIIQSLLVRIRLGKRGKLVSGRTVKGWFRLGPWADTWKCVNVYDKRSRVRRLILLRTAWDSMCRHIHVYASIWTIIDYEI